MSEQITSAEVAKAARNLERLADRVTNICERTIYIASGEMKELSTSDDETIHRTYSG